MDNTPTAFVSYSWDSNEHKDWVLRLVSKLFANGIDTAIDVFETQNDTVNLFNMMLKNIKERDYTILVLTEEYAKKADSLLGGVGFETNVLIPYIVDNLKKIIPVVRTNGDKSSVIPFYLRGVYYIDFSEDIKFEESFTELLHRIYNVNLVEKPKLGQKPDLKPKKIEISNKKNSTGYEDNNYIPDFSQITDVDKNKFLKKSYSDITDSLLNFLEATKVKNSSFDFDFEPLTTKKTIIKLYLNGQHKYSAKIWLGSSLGGRHETINISYGHFIDENDNSMNEIIICEVDKNNNLLLKMTMSFFGNKNATDANAIAKEIWQNLVNYIK